MGGAGFGQGLVQGLQQAQDRHIQLQELKLQQDHAKSRQKSMEAEDQLKQLQLHNLTRKIQGQSNLDQLDFEQMQQSPEMPVAFDQRKMAMVMQAAAQAGEDPNQVLERWAMADTTGQIRSMLTKMKPPELVKLKKDEDLLEVTPGGASGEETQPKTSDSTASAQEGPAALGQSMQPQGAGGSRVKVLAKGTEKEGKPHNLNATEAEVIGDFANTYPDKMALIQQSLGHVPSLNEIGQHFTPQEFAGVMQIRQRREEQSRINVARETGVNAAKTAADMRRKEPILEEAGNFFRFNPQTGMIDGIGDPMMSKEDVSKAGYRKVATTHADKIERFNDIEFDLKPRIQRLKDYAAAIITATGGVNAWKQGANLNFDALMRSGQLTEMVDPSTGKPLTVGEVAQLYKSQVDTIREPYARSINGLKGTATERDILSAGAAFTAVTETTAINSAKFQEIDDRLEDVKRSAVASIFGAQAVKGKQTKPKPPTGAEADTDFLSMLPADVKAKYLKMSPSDQGKYKRVFMEEMAKKLGR